MGQALDVQGAFAAVEVACRNNGVRNDDRTQRIYVRRGQRRKIMKAARWRRLFKAGFVQEVNRVHRMRKQGW